MGQAHGSDGAARGSAMTPRAGPLRILVADMQSAKPRLSSTVAIWRRGSASFRVN
jgi:hypothetical protein